MRKYLKLVFAISIILVSGLVFIIGIYIPSVEESKKSYIATDDTYYSGLDRRKTVNGDKTLLIAGRYNNISSSAVFYSFVRFDLTDNPKYWETCEFSFYVYEYDRGYRDVNFMLLPYNWNEQMPSYDVKWNLPFITVHYTMYHSLGLQKLNITNHRGNIENNETITIMIWATNTHLYENNYIIIHSKEANTTIDKLPQLIWS